MTFKLDKCLVCGNTDLTTYLDFGKTPWANGYKSNKEEAMNQEQFSLALQFCSSCSHSQLTHGVDPAYMFTDYPYVSGTSKSLSDYFDTLVAKVEKRIINDPGGPASILELACNDGTLLSKFKDKGYEVLGVDPAKNICKIACDKGLPVLPWFWGTGVSGNVGKHDVIIAVNVLPHVPDPYDFLLACKNALAKGGKIYIQTSQCEMFQRGEFDCVYHEHYSYFTAKSFYTLAKRVGLFVIDAEKVDIHSKSYLFTLSADYMRDKEAKIHELIDEEGSLQNLKFYQNFSERSKATANNLCFSLIPYLAGKCVGLGASAKFNTVSNWKGVSLDCIVDDNPMKQGLHTPGCGIPIISMDQLDTDTEKTLFVATTWNFLEEFTGRLREKGYGGCSIITYFPELKISIV